MCADSAYMMQHELSQAWMLCDATINNGLQNQRTNTSINWKEINSYLTKQSQLTKRIRMGIRETEEESKTATEEKKWTNADSLKMNNEP